MMKLASFFYCGQKWILKILRSEPLEYIKENRYFCDGNVSEKAES